MHAPPKSPSPIVEDPRPVIVSSSRVGRAHKKPKRFDDFLPTNASRIPLHLRPPVPPPLLPRDPSPRQSPDPSPAPEIAMNPPVQTEPNKYGLYCVYPAVPSNDPEEDILLDNLCDSPNLRVSAPATSSPLSGFGIPALNTLSSGSSETPAGNTNSHALFLNKSIFLPYKLVLQWISDEICRRT